MRYTIFTTLRDLCIKRNFFNAGTNIQYEKMFDLAEGLVKNAADENLAVIRLADVIWICTSDTEYNDVHKAIKEWFEQMKRLSAEH